MTKDEIVQVNRYYLILISVIFLVDTSVMLYELILLICSFVPRLI